MINHELKRQFVKELVELYDLTHDEHGNQIKTVAQVMKERGETLRTQPVQPQPKSA